MGKPVWILPSYKDCKNKIWQTWVIILKASLLTKLCMKLNERLTLYVYKSLFALNQSTLYTPLKSKLNLRFRKINKVKFQPSELRKQAEAHSQFVWRSHHCYFQPLFFLSLPVKSLAESVSRAISVPLVLFWLSLCTEFYTALLFAFSRWKKLSPKTSPSFFSTNDHSYIWGQIPNVYFHLAG